MAFSLGVSYSLPPDAAQGEPWQGLTGWQGLGGLVTPPAQTDRSWLESGPPLSYNRILMHTYFTQPRLYAEVFNLLSFSVFFFAALYAAPEG